MKLKTLLFLILCTPFMITAKGHKFKEDSLEGDKILAEIRRDMQKKSGELLQARQMAGSIDPIALRGQNFEATGEDVAKASKGKDSENRTKVLVFLFVISALVVVLLLSSKTPNKPSQNSANIQEMKVKLKEALDNGLLTMEECNQKIQQLEQANLDSHIKQEKNKKIDVLDKLYKDGLISYQEFNAKRNEIINS